MHAPASIRGTAKQAFPRRCSEAMHAEHADGDCVAAPPVTRCRQRVSVAIECVIDGLGATRKHQRVLRASPYCICAGFFLCCGTIVSRRRPFRQIAGNSSNAAVISKVSGTDKTVPNEPLPAHAGHHFGCDSAEALSPYRRHPVNLWPKILWARLRVIAPAAGDPRRPLAARSDHPGSGHSARVPHPTLAQATFHRTRPPLFVLQIEALKKVEDQVRRVLAFLLDSELAQPTSRDRW